VGDALDSLSLRIKVSRDGTDDRDRDRDSSPVGRRRGNNSSPDAARRSNGTVASPREGMGTRLRDALEGRMGEWASAAGHAADARREARGEVALEPENDPAT
jgi:hypothetical protein|tara:strand:+ start:1066 stop:1371 length:306 start_codon:yes stop_codon:yes gene_type:complete